MSVSANGGLYQSLSNDRPEIRIVELQPGPRSGSICVALETVSFKDSDFVSYEALSYTWGSNKHSRPIRIATGNVSWTVGVTNNLYEALVYLRHEQVSRSLWIDTLSINQADVEERSQQVALMGAIFSRASKVTAWIGPHENGSWAALACFRMIAANVVVHWATKELNSKNWDPTSSVPFGEAEISAIHRFIQRPYFGRMWVWQEVRLSSSRCVLKCGTDEMPWEDFCTSVRFLCLARFRRYDDSVDATISSLRDIVVKLDRLCDPRTASFLDMVEGLRSRQCADPRDRLYSSQLLLRLASDIAPRSTNREFSISAGNDDPQLAPDYTRPVEEVFIDAAIRTLHATAHLHFLIYTGAVEDPLDGHHVEINLPSWVPDWRAPSRTIRMAGTRAAAGSTSHASVSQDRALTTDGLVVDAIWRVYPFTDHASPQSVARFAEALSNTLKAVSRDCQVASIGPLVVSQALCMNEFAETHVPLRSDLPDSQSCFQIVDHFMEQQRYSRLPQVERVLRHMSRYCRGRSIYISEKGNVGLGPEDVRVGDKIAVMLGCPVAATLRPLDSTHFQFIGPTYHAGIMNGEAFLGPLPERYKAVFHRHPHTSKLHWAYLDQETGLVQYEDPRLPPLPSEWTRVDQTSKHEVPIYRHERNGQICSYDTDPRCTAEELLRRGVSIERIILV